jgi:hypothetical protein
MYLCRKGFSRVVGITGPRVTRNPVKNHNRSEFLEVTPSTVIFFLEDEWAINRIFMEKASSENLCLVSLIWHPWSLATFDLEMKMLEYAFAGAREIGLSRVPMPTCTNTCPANSTVYYRKSIL